MKSMGATRAGLGALGVLLALSALACGGSTKPKSATEKACDARSEFNSAVQKAQSDLAAGNFGDAQKSVAEVRTAYDQVTASIAPLASEQREAIAPQIEELQGDINAINDVGSIDGLRVALQNAKGDLEAAQSALQDNLRCS